MFIIKKTYWRTFPAKNASSRMAVIAKARNLNENKENPKDINNWKRQGGSKMPLLLVTSIVMAPLQTNLKSWHINFALSVITTLGLFFSEVTITQTQVLFWFPISTNAPICKAELRPTLKFSWWIWYELVESTTQVSRP